MQTQLLRDLVTERINQRWADFAAAHPHLAAVIDRTRLTDAAVERLRADAAFEQALRDADIDEAKLAAIARALRHVEAMIDRILRM